MSRLLCAAILLSSALLRGSDGAYSNGGCSCMSSCPASPDGVCETTSGCGSSYGCNCYWHSVLWVIPWWSCDNTCWQDPCTRLAATGPGGGSNLLLGSSTRVSWSSNNAGPSMRVELWRNIPFYPDALVSTAATSASTGAGGMNWAIPSNLGSEGVDHTSGYYIFLTSSYGLTSQGPDFNLRAGSLAPIQDPASEVTHELGTATTFRWSPQNIGGTVTLELRKGDWWNLGLTNSYVRTITTTASAAVGTLPYTYPFNLGNGYGTSDTSRFYLSMWSNDNSNVRAESAYYNIRSASVTLTSPGSRSTMTLDNPVSIGWNAGALTGTVAIELRWDRCDEWNPLTYWDCVTGATDLVYTVTNSVAASAGVYAWQIPASLGSDWGTGRLDRFYLRVYSTANSGIADETSHDLRLVAGTITLSAPAGGSTMRLGDPVGVRWSSVGVTGTVTVQLYRANFVGAFGIGFEMSQELVTTASSTASASSGALDWGIPTLLPPGSYGAFGLVVRDRFYFRVTSNANGNVRGETPHSLNLLPQLTSELSSTVQASSGSGHVMSKHGCVCTSPCSWGLWDAPCDVSALDACPGMQRHWIPFVAWGTFYDQCDAEGGMRAAFPAPADLSSAIPITFSAPIAGASPTAWTVDLMRVRSGFLQSDAPEAGIILRHTASTDRSLSVDMIVPASVNVGSGLSGPRYYLRYSVTDSYGRRYEAKSPRIVFSASGPVRPQPEYSPVLASKFWALSHLAYNAYQHELDTWTCDACQYTSPLTNVVDVQAWSYISMGATRPYKMRAVVGLDALTGSIVVSVMGTNGTEQLIVQDGLAGLTSVAMAQAALYSGCANCYIISGMYAGLDALAGPVLRAITALNATRSPSGRSIYLTGHSLGGAMAELMAYELTLAGYPVEGEQR